MGATTSQQNTPSFQPNGGGGDPFAGQPDAFRVFVTTRKRKLISGTLKVTENEIMFFRSGEETLVWPLHFLRRYGFTSSGVFSFESGRRCATGEGLYSFTSQHAERIFQLVQARIQDNANLSAAMRDSRAQSTSTTSSMQSLITIPSITNSARIHPVQRYSSEGGGSLILTARSRPRSLATPPIHSTAWPPPASSTTNTPVQSDCDDDIFGTVIVPVPTNANGSRPGSTTPTHHAPMLKQQYINVLPPPIKQRTITGRTIGENGTMNSNGGVSVIWRPGPSNSTIGTAIRHSTENPIVHQNYSNLRRGTSDIAPTAVIDRAPTPPKIIDYAAVNLGSATLPLRTGQRSHQHQHYPGINPPASRVSYATVDLDKTRALEESAMARLLYTNNRFGQLKHNRPPTGAFRT